MIRHGCCDCKYLKCYPGDRWTPDDYECQKDGPNSDDMFVRVVENGETWTDSEECLCEHYAELRDDFWE